MKSPRNILLLIAVVAALLAVFWQCSAGKNPGNRAASARTASSRKPTARLINDRTVRSNTGAVTLRSDDSTLPFIFRLASQQTANAIRQWAQQQNLPVSALASLNLLRIPLTERQLQELLKAFPDASHDYFQDGLVSLPPQPGLAQGSEYGLPFGSSYLAFLGVDANDENRGNGVKVAVIDTGILPHDDLAHLNIQVLGLEGEKLNPGQYLASAHGTAIASILAGKHGVAPAATLLSFPIIDESGTSSQFDLAAAIIAATDQGARLISVSLGGEGDSRILQEAIDYAWDNGAIVIASAGNDGLQQVAFPAACQNAVAVGAVDAAGMHMAFSNSGEQLDVAAPGVALRAADENNGWQAFSGTSAAVPCVTGVLACYLADHPYASPTETVEAMGATCFDAETAGHDNNTGYGIIDAWHLGNHEATGLPDAAVTSLLIEDNDDTSSDITLLVNAQNTGTDTLPLMTITTTIGENSYTNTFENVRPGQTVTAEKQIDVSSLPGDSRIPISGTVSLPDYLNDVRPGNQTRSASIVIESPSPKEN